MDDLFTKIIAREIPAEIIYEDDMVIAFLDINPTNKGHVLVVPKQKFRNIYDASPETLGAMMTVVQKIARAQRDTLDTDGANIIMNNEPAGGQEVFHAHIHVVPRFEGDQAYAPAKHVAYADGEIADVATKLKEHQLLQTS